jgi:hypothetical protein
MSLTEHQSLGAMPRSAAPAAGRYFEAPVDYRPTAGDSPSVFLAGGITNCPDWQETAARALLGRGMVVFNPRRGEYLLDDPAEAARQIAWEHRHLHLAGATLFWFPAGSALQPIALFELGAALGEGRRLAVGVEPGYPRALDVREQVALARPGLPVHEKLDEAVAAAGVAAFELSSADVPR